MRLLFGVAATLLLTTAAVAAAPEAKAPPAEKPICKRVYEADTGSHFQSSKRVCRSAAEWKEIEDNNARVLSTIRDHGGVTPSSAPGAGSPQ